MPLVGPLVALVPPFLVALVAFEPFLVTFAFDLPLVTFAFADPLVAFVAWVDQPFVAFASVALVPFLVKP